MRVTFDLPDQVIGQLKDELAAGLGQAAKEAFVIEHYRRGKLSLGDVAAILSFDTRIEAQSWLASRGVPLNYDLPALEADRKTLGKLFNVELCPRRL